MEGDQARQGERPLGFARLLAYCGTAPFLLAALFSIFPQSLPAGLAPNMPGIIGLIWALVILSFMAGTIWGMSIAGSKAEGTVPPPVLLIGSNLVAVAAWLAVILLPAIAAFIIGGLFILLLPLDQAARQRGWQSAGYWRMRWVLTSVVAACMMAIGFSA